jgi:hypothetical protein
MSFSSENGYLPVSIAELMEVIRVNVNTQFTTTYTTETFLGTGYYKYFYSLVQRLQENEVKTSEIFTRMQEYFNITNELIQRPNTTHPGIYDYFGAAGYFISTKPPIDADAGKLFICVDVDDNHARGDVTISSYSNLVSGTDDTVTVGATVFTAQVGSVTPGGATFQAATSNNATATSLASQINAHATAGALVEAWAVEAIVYIRALSGGTAGNAIALAYTDNDANVGATVSAATLLGGAALGEDDTEYDIVKAELCRLVRDCTVGGVISQGTESEEITMSNGQSFEFKYNLPDRIPILLRLTTVLSDNNEFTIASPDVQKETLFDNINSKYKLGKNFEPQRYFSVVDAPWAATVLLEWSDDNGGSYYSTVFEAEYDEVFTFELTDIEIVES